MQNKTIKNKQKRKGSDISKLSSEEEDEVEIQRETKDNFEEESKIINNIESKNKPSKSDVVIEYQEHLKSPTTPTNELKLETEFLLPFKYGWTRTLVYRSGTNRTKGDVYYFSDSGTKYRSLRELPELFKNLELTKENFTFARRPLFENDSQYEVVRESNPKQKKGIKKVESKSLPKPVKAYKPVKKSNRPNQTSSDSSDSSSDTNINKHVSRRDLVCTKRCRKSRGTSPKLICVHCKCKYHPACAIVQPSLLTPYFVCINCKSSITNNAETEFLNSNPASLHINEENEFIVGSLENSSQSVEILGDNKFVVVPKSNFSRMPFLSNSDDLTQVHVGRVLPDNTEQYSFELFRTADVIKAIDFKNVDQD